MDGLVAGRIVYFVFDDHSAKQVKAQRARGLDIYWPGNEVHAGDICPAMVVHVWSDVGVNLQVILDGPDSYWATSVTYNAEKAPRTWHWMFEGQATRHEPKPAPDNAAIPMRPPST